MLGIFPYIPLCTDFLIGFSMHTFSQHGPITGLKNVHYKGKRFTRVGGWGDPRPKPTKLHFNFNNPNKEGPYNLIPMRKSVRNGIRTCTVRLQR